MTPFKKAFVKTMGNEGEGQWSNRKEDRGGETYSGISRVYWPEWEGWPLIDQGDFTQERLNPLVQNFYRVNFWHRIQGDKLANLMPEIAIELFDSAVHCGVNKAVEFMQNAYNVANCLAWHLVVDGMLGPITIGSIKRYLETQPGSPEINAEILLNCMEGEQHIYYKANPHHKNNRGWFRRL